jgi:hypothetical protein
MLVRPARKYWSRPSDAFRRAAKPDAVAATTNRGSDDEGEDDEEIEHGSVKDSSGGPAARGA